MRRPSIPNLDVLMHRTPAVTNTDPRYLKWHQWLQEIDRDLTDLAITRHVWKSITDILDAHPAMPPSHLFEVLTRSYAVSQAVAVRRQGDPKPSTVTMVRLVSEISEYPKVLSREGFVALFSWGMQHLGDEQFNQWAAPGSGHVDGALVRENLAQLKAVIAPVKQYVDKHVAHLDVNRASFDIPTFDQLDAAIDKLFELFHRYNVLLTAVGIDSLVPVAQYDWLAPLRIPWLGADGGSKPDDSL